VKIKRQIVEEEDITLEVLLMIDVTKEVLYNKANGEKKLLALINATVSHEMRNPINSIYSQNL
jgi:signal transduction histidine kinase